MAEDLIPAAPAQKRYSFLEALVKPPTALDYVNALARYTTGDLFFPMERHRKSQAMADALKRGGQQ